jgi:CheY-like chemotaxis protein
MTAPILIVDDNPTNLKLLTFVLEAVGYEIRTAVDAPSALAVLAEWRPRVMLLDLQLPGMDGFQLATQLKADPATAGIVIVAVTAYAMPSDRARALAAGCDGFVTKPIDTRAIPRLVAELLAKDPA